MPPLCACEIVKELNAVSLAADFKLGRRFTGKRIVYFEKSVSTRSDIESFRKLRRHEFDLLGRGKFSDASKRIARDSRAAGKPEEKLPDTIQNPPHQRRTKSALRCEVSE